MLPSEWKEGRGRKIEEGGRRKEKRDRGRDRGRNGEVEEGTEKEIERGRDHFSQYTQCKTVQDVSMYIVGRGRWCGMGTDLRPFYDSTVL